MSWSAVVGVTMVVVVALPLSCSTEPDRSHSDSDPCSASDACAATCAPPYQSLIARGRYPTENGCNLCGCEYGGGDAVCERQSCPICDDIEHQYDLLLQRARLCNPESPATCTHVVQGDLRCGCDTLVDPDRWDEEAATRLRTSYAESCTVPNSISSCSACLAVNTGSCSAQGQCVAELPRAACRAEGVTYGDGVSSIPDPTSCNRCSCYDGHLNCSDAEDCAKPCAAGLIRAESCRECVAGTCVVVDTGCYPACTDDGSCAEGSCQAGACVTPCD